MKILANDGLSKSGIDALKKGGFEVLNVKVAQNQLENYINEHNIDALIVKSLTEVRDDLIDECPSLKLIAFAGVGMDTIDVDYAIDKGLHVINAPEASTVSVAEMVFAHLFGMVRFLHSANREMPLEGDSRFRELKKAYSDGTELRGKKLGIIGFGSIGQEVAKIAIGIGMEVIAIDDNTTSESITLNFFNGQKVNFNIEMSTKKELLKEADFITINVPEQEGYVIDTDEIEEMKDGVGIINTSRGSNLNEVALITAIENGKIQFAGLDVFENEPNPEIQLLMNPDLSLSPHIGAGTLEAEERVGLEIAKQIIELLR
ncbi:3-phosphoglycerate dehydrogenase [Polaribacter vadi]|uniref:3-phosphoglycerate dehydrogenase n=1 Tax=Polaribacter vadi TaxID=1774273 RepID=A0A1B8U232_9FLAO|nr:D-2-hydroxyacid dehydrogenase [Polaribacter vadi]AOW16374.1 3-phosphoglycerate dehydrogenase [Polaribacter vadi]OBY65926.1 3-phosphoglycerate dehydrogenase [Polaribacter vadi]